MRTTMNMSSYEIEPDAMEMDFEIVQDEMYGDEVLCAGWNPAVDMVCEQLLQVPTGKELAVAADLTTLESPDEVSSAVSDIFLRKMYSFQR